MSERHPSSAGPSSNPLELPEAVNAQAEAAASTNQTPAKGGESTSRKEETQSEGRKAKPLEHGHTTARVPKGSATEDTPIEQVPQLAYGAKLGQVDFSQDGFDTKAKVAGGCTVRT